MNVWRVAIDQGTGVPAGAAEAITSSLAGVGYLRFARNDRRAVVAAYEITHELLLSRAPRVGGRLELVSTVRSPSLGWCSPSPGADWLVCTSRTAQEDIVLMRPDGSETVRLMDDAAKDRNPTWSPDGSRIGFMSTRSGAWELWSIRKDGSDLRQMTDLRSDVYDTVWSPDGTRALTAASSRPPFGAWIFDVTRIAKPENVPFLQEPGVGRVGSEAWSPDGTRIAGSVLDSAGVPRKPMVWDLATRTVRVFEVPGPHKQLPFAVAGWLPDARGFFFASTRGLSLVDAASGKSTPVAAAEDGTRYPLSGDGRMLYTERDVLDADIWLLEEQASR